MNVLALHDWDGGPAFPGLDLDGETTIDGMSMLDFFAGQAMIGLADRVLQKDLPVRAYDIAEGMLAERRRRWDAEKARRRATADAAGI